MAIADPRGRVLRVAAARGMTTGSGGERAPRVGVRHPGDPVGPPPIDHNGRDATPGRAARPVASDGAETTIS